MRSRDSSAVELRALRGYDAPVPVPASAACLFLDIDGTLLDFASTPDGVSVDGGLIDVIAAARDAANGALALVSGRTIQDIDRLFAPLHLPAAGVHGYERRSASGGLYQQSTIDDRLPAARLALGDFVKAHHGLLLEDKGSALAVHYRRVPQLAGLVEATLAKVVTSLLPEYELLEGAAVLELKPSVHDKATAIAAFLREEPFAGRVPVYIGDDLTDYDGFVAVRKHRGFAVAVGDRVSADYRLESPAAVRAWLGAFAAQRVGDA
jgi:trehalose 6-phosphate phosphatase